VVGLSNVLIADIGGTKIAAGVFDERRKE